ncbi:hypothetical protein [Bizionia argentinensis]|uniref:hypothetical protein n=1 Tax=Bizionia argentinensis TaxID=456455 RepID=UPI00022302F9|nr:hypothetical protein [Bizionia argentinensis]
MTVFGIIRTSKSGDFEERVPWKALNHEYLSKEAEYLIDLGAKDFQKINSDT